MFCHLSKFLIFDHSVHFLLHGFYATVCLQFDMMFSADELKVHISENVFFSKLKGVLALIKTVS